MAHWKTHCNVAIETEKFHKTNNRNNTFITGCVKELNKLGFTHCFEDWQVEELKRRFENLEIRKCDNYFIVTKN